MPIRKKIYVLGEKVYICGNHPLNGKQGEVVKMTNHFGIYIVDVNNIQWKIRGRNLSPKLGKND